MANETPALQGNKITLGERKKQVEAALTAYDLSLQGIVKDVKDDGLVEAIKAYKAKFKKMQEERKDYTGYVESLLITPLIAKENELHPDNYAPFKSLAKRELDLRLKKAAEVSDANNLIKEKALYKEHIMNEFDRAVKEARLSFYQELTKSIEADCIDREAIAATLQAMAKTPRQYVKFQRTLIDDATALEIAKTIARPDFSRIATETMDNFDSLLDAHKKGKVAEITASKQAEIHEKHEEEKFHNNVIASQPQPEIKAPVVKVKRVIVFENTKAWAEAIISAFYENDHAWLMLKNKSFDKVTIGHMAEALSKCSDVTVEGVKYEEEKK